MPPLQLYQNFLEANRIPHPWIGLELIFVQNRNLTAETPRTQRTHFLFVPVQPEQIKSPLSRQNTDLLQSHSHQLQPKSIPEGMSFVIRSRQRRDWITKENISPRSLCLSGEPGFERDE